MTKQILERTEYNPERDRPVAVFDSGVGGISTLGALRRVLPKEHFIYYGDTANAPYGVKSREEIMACVRNVIDRLMTFGPKAIVIACNTASSVAAATLREEMTLPVIAIEPALKPASLNRHGGEILVLATPVTLRLEKFRHLMNQWGKGALPRPCSGLMELVETENMAGAERYLKDLLKEYEGHQLDAVVLGCTHYVFLRPVLKKLLPEATLILDGNAGTARQLKRVLEKNGMERTEGEGDAVFMTSGDERTVLPQMENWLKKAMSENITELTVPPCHDRPVM